MLVLYTSDSCTWRLDESGPPLNLVSRYILPLTEADVTQWNCPVWWSWIELRSDPTGRKAFICDRRVDCRPSNSGNCCFKRVVAKVICWSVSSAPARISIASCSLICCFLGACLLLPFPLLVLCSLRWFSLSYLYCFFRGGWSFPPSWSLLRFLYSFNLLTLTLFRISLPDLLRSWYTLFMDQAMQGLIYHPFFVYLLCFPTKLQSQL